MFKGLLDVWVLGGISFYPKSTITQPGLGAIPSIYLYLYLCLCFCPSTQCLYDLRLRKEGVLVIFVKPSNWKHLDKVWNFKFMGNIYECCQHVKIIKLSKNSPSCRLVLSCHSMSAGFCGGTG